MKIIPLGSETRLNTGFSHKVVIGYADITAAALTKTLTIFPDGSAQLPASFAVLRVGYAVRTVFTGGAVATMTVAIGDAASAARYMAAASSDLFTALGTNTKDTVVSTTAFALGANLVGASTATLTALFTSTVANLDALTQGLMEIYLLLSDLGRLKAVNEPGTT